MRLRPYKVAFFVLLALTPTSNALGQSSEPVSGAAFLLVPVGARTTALGQGGVAFGGSVEGIFWNPAGLATLENSQFAIHYANTFVSNNSALSGAFVIPDVGTLGISAYIADFGAQEITTSTGALNGRLAPKGVALTGSLASQFAGAISVGINYKLVQFRQDCSGACISPGGTRLESIVGTTHGIDLGLILGSSDRPGLALGAVLRHAGFKLQLENRDQADGLPTRLQFGAVYTLLVSAQTDANILARVMADVEGRPSDFSSPGVHVGLELEYGGAAYVRSGYAFLEGETSGPSVGVGLRFEGVTLDFARTFFRTGTFDDPLFVSMKVDL